MVRRFADDGASAIESWHTEGQLVPSAEGIAHQLEQIALPTDFARLWTKRLDLKRGFERVRSDDHSVGARAGVARALGGSKVARMSAAGV